MKYKIACIIPTYNGYSDLLRLLDSIDRQSAEFDLFVVDSSSSDGTENLVRSRVSNVITISSEEFNHGGTRQMMVSRNLGYDIFVFLTQDAYLEDSEAIANLVAPFRDESVGAVYGRQLPHLNASPFASFAREFNYPPASRVKSMLDAPILGIKTPFMSNSFSAYRREALLDVGGFPDHVILSEDMYVAAKMLISGWKLAYSGEACCRHSHNYSIIEEFKRYFDQGVFHSRERWVGSSFGGVGGEGIRYVKEEIFFLGLSRAYLWPEALFRNFIKFIAYRLGSMERYIPVTLKRDLSMHKRFWKNSVKERG